MVVKDITLHFSSSLLDLSFLDSAHLTFFVHLKIRFKSPIFTFEFLRTSVCRRAIFLSGCRRVIFMSSCRVLFCWFFWWRLTNSILNLASSSSPLIVAQTNIWTSTQVCTWLIVHFLYNLRSMQKISSKSLHSNILFAIWDTYRFLNEFVRNYLVASSRHWKIKC